MEKSLAYLEGFLDEKSMTYDKYIEEVTKPKGILESLLSAFKRIFR